MLDINFVSCQDNWVGPRSHSVYVYAICLTVIMAYVVFVPLMNIGGA